MDVFEQLHVAAPLRRILVEVSSPPRVVSIVDWIVDDQLLEWHQVQACQLRHITFRGIRFRRVSCAILRFPNVNKRFFT